MNLAQSRDPTDAAWSQSDRPLEPYRLLTRIGQGGMSEIYLAEWEPAPGVHRLVVVKRLLDHINEEALAVQMFLDEARVALRLSHPNIVQTHDVGIAGGRYCIAMEYLRGQPLHRVAQRVQAENQFLPIEAAVGIILDVLEALAYAHDAVDYDGTPLAVVHRDISPHNVFIQYDGRVKLLDFGIAKASTQEGRTRTGLVKGKFGYMAPEQALAAPVDRRADLWSVGVMLWELLTGLRLFKGNSEGATLNMTLTASIPPVSSYRPDTPEAIDVIVRRALTRDPERRYASALSMKEDLERSLESVSRDTASRSMAPLMAELFEAERRAQERAVCELVTRGEGPPSSQRTSSVGTPFTSVATIPPQEVSVTVLVDELRRKDRLLARTFLTMIAFVLAMVAGLAFAVLRQKPVVPPLTGNTAVVAATAVASPVASPVPAESSERAIVVLPVSAVVESEVATPTPAAALPAPVRARTVFAAPAPKTPPAKGGTMRVIAPSQPPSPAAEQRGFLTLDTTPWSVVSIGGRVLGQTPIVGASLPAGDHAVSLSNPELKLHTTYFVRIEPGLTTVRRVGLE